MRRFLIVVEKSGTNFSAYFPSPLRLPIAWRLGPSAILAVESQSRPCRRRSSATAATMIAPMMIS